MTAAEEKVQNLSCILKDLGGPTNPGHEKQIPPSDLAVV